MAVIVSAFGSGLALGTASILSVGPNNIMMIREGLRAGRTWLVGSTVWSSYVVLIAAASLMTKPITTGLSPLREALSWLGIAAVLWFAIASIRAALWPLSIRDMADGGPESRGACFGRVLMVIWLNPLTYVELLVIPAAVCASLATPRLRLDFTFGLLLMTTVCCFTYLLGGSYCATLLRHPRTLQVFDLASGLILATVAVAMAAGMA